LADPDSTIGGQLFPPFPSHTVLFPFPPLLFPLPSVIEVGPLNTARRSGERCNLSSRVWGGSPEEVEFGAF